jgi:DNA-binding XRE family transcriptional regulator
MPDEPPASANLGRAAASETHCLPSPDELSIIVGSNLRRLRRRQGHSLERLAQLSGVSRAMLGQIETGKPTINLYGRWPTR